MNKILFTMVLSNAANVEDGTAVSQDWNGVNWTPRASMHNRYAMSRDMNTDQIGCEPSPFQYNGERGRIVSEILLPKNDSSFFFPTLSPPYFPFDDGAFVPTEQEETETMNDPSIPARERRTLASRTSRSRYKRQSWPPPRLRRWKSSQNSNDTAFASKSTSFLDCTESKGAKRPNCYDELSRRDEESFFLRPRSKRIPGYLKLAGEAGGLQLPCASNSTEIHANCNENSTKDQFDILVTPTQECSLDEILLDFPGDPKTQMMQ